MDGQLESIKKKKKKEKEKKNLDNGQLHSEYHFWHYRAFMNFCFYLTVTIVLINVTLNGLSWLLLTILAFQ